MWSLILLTASSLLLDNPKTSFNSLEGHFALSEDYDYPPLEGYVPLSEY